MTTEEAEIALFTGGSHAIFSPLRLRASKNPRTAKVIESL